MPSPRIAFPAEVEVGDFLLSNLQAGAFFEVVEIEAPVDFPYVAPAAPLPPQMTAERSTREFRFVLIENGRRQLRGYTGHMPTAVMEMGKCGRRVCVRHIREFDDDARQCAEHWPNLDNVFSGE
jgi:hypothetical protein